MKKLRLDKKIKELKKKVTIFGKDVIKKVKTPRILIVIIVGLILLVGILLARYFLIAAVVNGQPISRLSLVRELEKQGGSSVLDNLIEQNLIFQEAKNLNVKVTDEEVNTEVKKLEDYLKEQQMTLDEALSIRGQTKADLVLQIKIQKVVEKILESKINVSEDEIKTYYNENKSSFAKGSTLESLKDQIKSQLEQQKLSEEYNKWIEEIKAKAKILYFIKF